MGCFLAGHSEQYSNRPTTGLGKASGELERITVTNDWVWRAQLIELGGLTTQHSEHK